MKIFAVGWNYNSHNKEMDNTLVLNEPVIFLKPESAILKDGKPFFYPDWSSQIEYEAEIVVRIDRLGKNIQSKFAYRYYNRRPQGSAGRGHRAASHHIQGNCRSPRQGRPERECRIRRSPRSAGPAGAQDQQAAGHPGHRPRD